MLSLYKKEHHFDIDYIILSFFILQLEELDRLIGGVTSTSADLVQCGRSGKVTYLLAGKVTLPVGTVPLG